MLIEMLVGVLRKNTYAEFCCTNEDCDEGEFARRLPPIYISLPDCPNCGCPSVLLEVLCRQDS